MVATSQQDELEFGLLGTFEVAVGDRVLEIGSPKQRALLATLLLQLNRVVPLDALVEELWGANVPTSANVTVQSLVYRLRRALVQDAPSGVSLRAKVPGYVLEAKREQVDIYRFEDLLARGREQRSEGDHEGALVSLEAALALWRGPALTDLAVRGLAAVEASRLDDARVTLVEELVEIELTLSRPEQALARLEPHVVNHPLRERAWGQLMVALYRLGRQAEALGAYQRVRKILSEELGLEPTPALRRLEKQILHQSPELEGASSPPPGTGPAPVEPSPARRPRPGDTLAFLFTDIEASTRRWEGEREVMAEALARHDDLLRGVVVAHEGRVFAHTGDGLCSVFPTAPQAFAAALAAQRLLLNEDWGPGEPLRVRMAIHAGAAEPREGNYVGPTLNRAARLLATAHGGQIVCSQAAADLEWDELPGAATLLDLGEHRLADLSRPERVFQVAHAELPIEFPPLRSLDTRRHNLSVNLTSFVGRCRELRELEALLADATRLLTLIGTGGAGKTRLALQLAAGALERFSEGVFLIELAPLRDPGLVSSAVASALGIQTAGLGSAPGALEERLCEHLESRCVLLLFDNCEHVVETVAALVEVLLSRCPDLVVLATSRELLGVAGEVAWRVPPLSLPPAGTTRPEELADSDAVSLFCARARAAQPGFALTAANAKAVSEICRRLDGIPLALELAAARLRLLSAEQVARRLDDRFRLLTGGARTAVARHQTLRAAMDWSHDLLAPSEQAALRRLAVFPGSFDLEAAEAVVAGAEEEKAAPPGDYYEVLDLLARLVEKSLLAVDAEDVEVRYRLLETVRHYAGEKLTQAGEAEMAHRLHRDFYLALVRPFPSSWVYGGPQAEKAEARLCYDYDNFRVALEWSLATDDADASLGLVGPLWVYWLWGGHELEGCTWLERALALSPSPRTLARVESLSGLGYLSSLVGGRDPGQSELLLDEGLHLALELDDRIGVSRAHYLLAYLKLGRGDLDGAEQHVRRALEGLEDMKVHRGMGWCRYLLGWLAMARGEREAARAHFEQAVVLSRHGGQPQLTCHALAALPPLLAYYGEAERAGALADEGVEAARRLGLSTILTMALVRCSEAAILAGHTQRAETAVREALSLLGDVGGRRWVAETLEMAALMHETRCRPAAAARLFGACDALRQALGEGRGELRCIYPQVQNGRQRVTEELGEDAYEEQRNQGQGMTVAEAIFHALFELDEGPRGWEGDRRRASVTTNISAT